MLVRLTSSTSGKMLMFAEHAHVLFGWIGKECSAHGVFTKEQLSGAIACLRRGAEEEKLAIAQQAREKKNGEKGKGSGEEDADKNNKDKESRSSEPVMLGQRAQPLIQLMERTLMEDGFVLWEAPGDF